jgi:hypothetical protein
MNKFATFVHSLPKNPQFIRWAVRIILLSLVFSVLAYFYVPRIKQDEEVVEEEVSLLPDIQPTEPVSFDLLPENAFTEIPDPSVVKPVRKKPRQITEDERIALSTDEDKRQLLNKQLDDIVEYSEQKYSKSKSVKKNLMPINKTDNTKMIKNEEINLDNNGFIFMLGLTGEFTEFDNKNVIAADLSIENDNENDFTGGISLDAAYQKNFSDFIDISLGIKYLPHLSNKSSLFNFQVTTEIELKYSIDAYLQPILKITDNSAFTFKAGISKTQLDANNQSVDFIGQLIGIGYRYQFDENIFIFGEYNKHFYSSQKTASIIDGAVLKQDLNFDLEHLTLGIGYKF